MSQATIRQAMNIGATYRSFRFETEYRSKLEPIDAGASSRCLRDRSNRIALYCEVLRQSNPARVRLECY